LTGVKARAALAHTVNRIPRGAPDAGAHSYTGMDMIRQPRRAQAPSLEAR